MPVVTYQGQAYESRGRTLLDCLTANGVDIPHACRAGVCQSCRLRVVRGSPPPGSQHGLGPAQVARGDILACRSVPTDDLEVAPVDAASATFEARVCAVEALSEQVRAVRLTPPPDYGYRAGQFLSLHKDARTARNYSLASVPGIDRELLLHVRKVPGGSVSGWIFRELSAGDRVRISEPLGDCFYLPGEPDRPLLLVGSGTGIAPLSGIAREALAAGHRGRIELYHASRDLKGQYLARELRELDERHANFRYHPWVERGSGDPSVVATVLRHLPDLAGWRVYLCGNPALVESARLELFLAGASSGDIHADPFLPTAPHAGTAQAAAGAVRD